MGNEKLYISISITEDSNLDQIDQYLNYIKYNYRYTEIVIVNNIENERSKTINEILKANFDEVMDFNNDSEGMFKFIEEKRGVSIFLGLSYKDIRLKKDLQLANNIISDNLKIRQIILDYLVDEESE